jgi:predicted amidohydrolase
MKICVLSSALKDIPPLPECDVALLPFGAVGAVDYESELDGRTDKFEGLARLSKLCDCAILCGCETCSRGIKRRSVAVADRGKLMGISDMLNVLDGEEVKGGAYVGAYTLKGYKVGLCIETDLYFPETVKALSLVGCNLICIHFKEFKDGMPPVLMRAYAYLYGVPVVASAGKVAYFADMSGAIASSSQKISIFESDIKNSYHVVSSRRRGLFSDFSEDY